MDNEHDYVELNRLLAKCKYTLCKELSGLKSGNMHDSPIIDDYERSLKIINELIVKIPIIIKGDTF